MLWATVAGEVTVRLTIGKDGLVKDAVIVKSSDKSFEPTVLGATAQWRFTETSEIPPAEPKGLIVDCVIKFGFDGD